MAAPTPAISDRFEEDSITEVFGGSEIDLRKAQLATRSAALDVTTLSGGVEIIIPVDWLVTVSGLPRLGGWENLTKNAG